MFEHMKNYEKLMAKVSDWLSPTGKIFIHIFTHKKFAYHFQKGKALFTRDILTHNIAIKRYFWAMDI